MSEIIEQEMDYNKEIFFSEFLLQSVSVSKNQVDNGRTLTA